MKLPQQQRGVSILTAVFLITGLAVLGAMMTRMMVMSSTETISEWRSAQALYAAESGVDWAARYITDNNACGAPYTTSDREVVSGQAWFDLSISCNQVDALNLYTISSTGKAGNSSAAPATQRELQVLFSLDN
jgi:type II secretory pathway component PulK